MLFCSHILRHSKMHACSTIVWCIIICLLLLWEEDHQVPKTYLNYSMTAGIFIISISWYLILSQEQNAGAWWLFLNENWINGKQVGTWKADCSDGMTKCARNFQFQLYSLPWRSESQAADRLSLHKSFNEVPNCLCSELSFLHLCFYFYILATSMYVNSFYRSSFLILALTFFFKHLWSFKINKCIWYVTDWCSYSCSKYNLRSLSFIFICISERFFLQRYNLGVYWDLYIYCIFYIIRCVSLSILFKDDI